MGRNKIQHFIVSAAVVIVVNAIAGIWWAIAIAALWGILKEWDDQRKGGKFDLWDLVADGLGIILGAMLT